MNDIEQRLDAAIAQCPFCRQIGTTAVAVHRRDVLKQIEETQNRKLTPFPKHIWPNGRAPR